MGFIEFLGSLDRKFDGYPLFIQIALVVIVISIATLLLTYAIIVLQRLEFSIRQLKLIKVRKMVNNELSNNLMLNDNLKDKDIDKLVGRLNLMAGKDKLVNEVILEELIFFRRNFSGAIGKVLGSVHDRLNFRVDAIGKLKSIKWNIKAEGLREIQELPSLTDDRASIEPLLNAKNNDVRIEAQAAYIRLNKNDPFKFLNSASCELLEWHQIILLEIISNTPDLTIPLFKKWLSSPNLSVISFSAKLIVYYQQLDAIPELTSLLGHPAARIKHSVLDALTQLQAKQAEQKMIDIFPKATLPVKVKIVEALGTIHSGKHVNFLREQFFDSKEFSLRKTAACALLNQPRFNKDKFINEVKTLSPEHNAILEHCMDDLIRN